MFCSQYLILSQIDVNNLCILLSNEAPCLQNWTLWAPSIIVVPIFLKAVDPAWKIACHLDLHLCGAWICYIIDNPGAFEAFGWFEKVEVVW